tara:strand:+ start:291 stop:698 length:408 start_codon:yes stop_codon:yes gene_type:complete
LKQYLKQLRDPSFGLGKEAQVLHENKKNRHTMCQIYTVLHLVKFAGLSKPEFTKSIIQAISFQTSPPKELVESTKILLNDLYEQVHNPEYRISLLPEALRDKFSDGYKGTNNEEAAKIMTVYSALYDVLDEEYNE